MRTPDKTVYNLNKNTSDTAGSKLCLLVCLVFQYGQKRFGPQRSDSEPFIPTLFSSLQHTHTEASVLMHLLALQLRPLHPYSCCLFSTQPFWRAHNNRSNNCCKQRRPNPRSAIVVARLLSPPPAPSFSSLHPSFFPDSVVVALFVSCPAGGMLMAALARAKTISWTHNAQAGRAIAGPQYTGTGKTHTR